MFELIKNFLFGVITKVFLVFRTFYGVLFIAVLVFLLYIAWLYLKNRSNRQQIKINFSLFKWFTEVFTDVNHSENLFLTFIRQVWAFIFAVINILALLLIVSGVYFLNLFPFWNRKRKKFKKEVKPKIGFQTGRSFLLMVSGFEVIAILLTP